ncbi:hypothetical protein EZV62_014972 [Acer yangbiense]|uniref:Zinc knuckle CX2CX4HX4C domain-containing protein n=1 Tax=Acer yangbiense TaxID=1000413 RepID=A0A5C7HUE0_9ROSI|nr:hypothetical protein EZV62_014972 [Acer yangbiense]
MDKELTVYSRRKMPKEEIDDRTLSEQNHESDLSPSLDIPDDISRLCVELSIHGKDEKLWSVQNAVTKVAEKKMDLCLVGKILSPKHVNRETFRAVIPKIWQTTVDIEMVQDNMYLFSFRNPSDRFRVLIINAPLICMTKEMGEFTGSCVGELVDIDVGVTSECFGKYMRLKVAIDISKPLKRFLRLELKQGVESMLLIRYEKLPEYCFHYGVIGHSYQVCQAMKDGFVFGMDFTYGSWLRATGVPRQHRGPSQFHSNGGGSNQRVMKRNINNRDGLRSDQPMGGSQIRSIQKQVEQQHPLSVAMEEDLHGSTGQQVCDSVEASSTLGADLCSPLKLLNVVVEFDFRFRSREVVNGNRGGSMVVGKGVKIIKKKGKWKRWAREGGAREVGSMGGDVEGRKRLNRVELETGGGGGSGKKQRHDVAFD